MTQKAKPNECELNQIATKAADGWLPPHTFHWTPRLALGRNSFSLRMFALPRFAVLHSVTAFAFYADAFQMWRFDAVDVAICVKAIVRILGAKRFFGH